MLNKWNYLNECADGAHVISKIKSCYDDYEQELDRIEFEIQAYNNTSDEEWDMIVKEGKVPTSVWLTFYRRLSGIPRRVKLMDADLKK